MTETNPYISPTVSRPKDILSETVLLKSYLSESVSIPGELIRPRAKDLKGAEASFAGWSPTLYGVTGAVLELIPFAKYALPSNFEELVEADDSDFAVAMALHSLGAALWGAAPFIGPLGKRLVSKAAAKAGKLRKVKKFETPVEDLTDWQVNSYRDTVLKELSKKGLNSEEREAVIEALQGTDRLLGTQVIKSLMGKTKLTKAFESLIEPKSGRIPGMRLKSAIQAELDPLAVRSRDMIKGFTEATKQRFQKKQFYHPGYARVAYKQMAERFYGKEAARWMKIENASDEQIMAFTTEILEGKGLERAFKLAAAPQPLVLGRQVRIVYGYGEDTFGTLTGIHDRVIRGIARRNIYSAQKAAEFNEMLVQRGLATRILGKDLKGRSVIKRYKRSKEANPQAFAEANDYLTKMDDIVSVARKTKEPEALKLALTESEKLFDGASPTVKAIIEATRDFMDMLYGERMIWKLDQLFEKVGLSSFGREGLSLLNRKHHFNILDTLSTARSVPYLEKVDKLKGILKEYRSWATETPGIFRESLGKKASEEVLEGLKKNLTMGGSADNFLTYLEEYAPRIFAEQAVFTEKIFRGLAGKGRASYTRRRVLAETMPKVANFESRISARLNAQAKEMFLLDEIEAAGNYAKQLPEAWRSYTEHYFARVLNIPSAMDAHVGKFLTMSVGKFETFIGKEGIWDARRVMNLAKTTNDFTYMGFIGLKPFSALRNYFQVLLTVPADLGGIKNIVTMTRGMAKAYDPVERAYLRKLGIITEYVPEMELQAGRLLDIGKVVLGKELPTMNQVRDFTLWMFKSSDRFSRYVAGASAHVKWNDAMLKVGLRESQTRLVLKEVKELMRQTGSNNRNPWIRNGIEEQLRLGNIKNAKEIFIKDVVADTQFLYGVGEAPVLAQVGGPITKTGVVFQSWWANYSELIFKWYRTGVDPGAKAKRFFSFMLSSTIGYTMMRAAWGKDVAFRSTFLGPLPDPGTDVLIPPIWQPFVQGFGGVIALGKALNEEGITGVPPEALKQATAMAKTAFGFVPGGLQIKQLVRGGTERGPKGILQEIVRYRPEE